MTDAIDLHQAVLTPATVEAWPVTTAITRVDVRPSGFHLEFAKRSGAGRWPDVVPPGWEGPIAFTVWLGAQVNGQWHVAASLNVWLEEGDGSYGGPVADPVQYASNLYYLDPALQGHTPQVGEAIALFVTAGAQRGVNAFLVAERSAVITFPMPGPAGATYTFESAPPPVDPPPVVVDPPVDDHGNGDPSADTQLLTLVLKRLDDLEALIRLPRPTPAAPTYEGTLAIPSWLGTGQITLTPKP
jgi:hypothetical protein